MQPIGEASALVVLLVITILVRLGLAWRVSLLLLAVLSIIVAESYPNSYYWIFGLLGTSFAGWYAFGLLHPIAAWTCAYMIATRVFRAGRQQMPNKAPEPTPGAVMPRAIEGDSK